MKGIKTIAYLFAMIIALNAQSCGSDNDNNEPDQPTKNDIVGTWKLYAISTDDGASFSNWPFETTSATFKGDGSYSGKGYFGNGSGTWKQNGKTVITYVKGEEFYRYAINSLTSSTCTLTMSQESSKASILVKCVKTSGANGEGMMTISKSELENITAFESNDDGDVTYLKFRDGNIYTKEVTESGFVCNKDVISYTLSGNKITMEFGDQKPSGSINKIEFPNGKIGIYIDLNGTFGIAKWLSTAFEKSDYQF